jgi:hypothetical protein
VKRCPYCHERFRPASLETHLVWDLCVERTAKIERSRQLHPSNFRPDGDAS